MTESKIVTRNVLVVDDEASVRDAIIDILELIDVISFTACDGEEGIEVFQNNLNDIKLIILDLTMPGLTGEETFISIRKLSDSIPIIVSSGHSLSELPIVFQQDSNCEFVQKPFTIDYLIERVQFHLGNST